MLRTNPNKVGLVKLPTSLRIRQYANVPAILWISDSVSKEEIGEFEFNHQRVRELKWRPLCSYVLGSIVGVAIIDIHPRTEIGKPRWTIARVSSHEKCSLNIQIHTYFHKIHHNLPGKLPITSRQQSPRLGGVGIVLAHLHLYLDVVGRIRRAFLIDVHLLRHD
jgi:hypothetical protein